MSTSIFGPVTTIGSAMGRALDAGQGVVRLAPAWVPRAFCTPGRRIRLHPHDYFPFAQDRGGIDERWLSSAVRADNGPQTGEFEGLSLVVEPDGALIPFDEFVAYHQADLIGRRLWSQHGRWPMYSKFFDNLSPLPFHVHHTDERAALVGKPGKPEAYYYSPHMNNYPGDQSITFLGLQPHVTPADFIDRIMLFGRGGDNRITELSAGYRTRLGTGWDVPAGVLHAPGSVCTYEPQCACDVFCMCESWSNNREVPEELLWKDVPPERHGDFEFIASLIEWDLNLDPRFAEHRFMQPYETRASVEAANPGYSEQWVVYRSPHFSAKELTVRPGAQVTIQDAAAYGCIVVQGHGQVGVHEAAAATLIRYGALSQDEFFVAESAANRGVTITNRSDTDDLVMLKHFGPANPEL